MVARQRGLSGADRRKIAGFRRNAKGCRRSGEYLNEGRCYSQIGDLHSECNNPFRAARAYVRAAKAYRRAIKAELKKPVPGRHLDVVLLGECMAYGYAAEAYKNKGRLFRPFSYWYDRRSTALSRQLGSK